MDLIPAPHPVRIRPDFDWLPPPKWSPSNFQYHANLAWWGSTMLKTFRDSPAEAHVRFISKTIEPKKPSAPLILGSLIHLLLLEPENYDEEVVVVHVQGKGAKVFKESQAANPQKMVVTQTENLKARLMAACVLNPKTEGARVARALLFDCPGVSEFSYRWNDELGVPCKVRFDFLCETKLGPTRINLKTTRATSLDAYERQAYDLGYHAQEAFYERGMLHMIGQNSAELEIVIHNEPPFEVAVVRPSAAFMERGRKQIKTDLLTLGEALKTPDRGSWASDWETEINVLDLPYYARNKDAESVVVDTF